MAEQIRQKFGLAGLTGRVISSTKAPEETTLRYSEMLDVLMSIFQQYQQDGKVEISYATEVVYGQLSEP